MSIDPLSDKKVVESWGKNAEAWSNAVRGDRIGSRVLATNRAILDAIRERSPLSVLDIGCGEGWLVRALASDGIEALGVDAVPGLIELALREGGGEFEVLSYEELADGALEIKVDVAVANFSLIGHESVDRLVARVPSMLARRGAFIIQTLHPEAACGDQPYEDAWRPGTWNGFGSEFVDPAPWYFRTIESWLRLLRDSGFSSVDVREPLNPATGRPASAVFVAEIA